MLALAAVSARAAALLEPPPAGELPPPKSGLTKLKLLDIGFTQITDAGCATLAAALDSGALPVLERVFLQGTPASAAAKAAVEEALTTFKAAASS